MGSIHILFCNVLIMMKIKSFTIAFTEYLQIRTFILEVGHEKQATREEKK